MGSIHLFDVADAYLVEDRKFILVALPVGMPKVSSRESIELRSTEKHIYRTIDWCFELIRVTPRVDGKIPIGIGLPMNIPVEFCQTGTEIWSVE